MFLSALSSGGEARLSSRSVILLLALVGIVVLSLSSELPNTQLRWQVAGTSLAFGFVATASWVLERLCPRCTPWFLTGMTTALMHGVVIWLPITGSHILLLIPVILASVLLGSREVVALGVVESGFVIAVPHSPVQRVGAESTAVVLIAIWIVVCVLVLYRRDVGAVVQWSVDLYDRAREVMEEARSRREETEEALGDVVQLNRQLALAAQRLSTLRHVAEEARESKAAFVARVSHEFRTPLNMIIGLASLMVESPDMYAEELPPDLWHDLNIIFRNCQHLSSMINDVLDLSQAEVGRLVLRREWVDLRDVIDGALSIVRPLIDKKSLSLTVDIPSSLPCVFCDSARIRQVILNLLTNAARYTDVGGIEVSVTARESSIVVSVSDTGPGIAQEEVQRIFQPFYQTPDGVQQRKRGSGLGLSISREFVRLHEGRIWVESEMGRGSAVYVELPISSLANQRMPPERLIREDWIWNEPRFRTDRSDLPSPQAKSRMVVVDSTGSLRPEFPHLAEGLELIEVDALDDVPGAVQEAAADVVLANLSEPDQLVSAARYLRQFIADVPVVTCHVPPRLGHVYAAGADDFLIKPVTREDLTRALSGAGREVSRVLIVDDDQDLLDLVTRMLRLDDPALELTTATTGESALRTAREWRPDLILLDIILPDLSGWDVLARLKKDPVLGEATVVFLTAQDPAQCLPAANELYMTTVQGVSAASVLRCALESVRALTL
ncbi:MAG: hybrid sensor histidine kinase/response regulator [Chloroflexi bacterium]|nr:hybrid sensor histidine kinase/response regulator [Chloroflexota bacterium]